MGAGGMFKDGDRVKISLYRNDIEKTAMTPPPKTPPKRKLKPPKNPNLHQQT